MREAATGGETAPRPRLPPALKLVVRDTSRAGCLGCQGLQAPVPVTEGKHKQPRASLTKNLTFPRT